MSSIGDLSSTSSWVKFFTESGIPQSVAANYAVTFHENRISKQMLLDLNKEILHDMGIGIMGDIIAILKHAKIVHAQLTRDKVFKGELSVAPVSPARRAVTGIARITTDVQSKVINEPPSQLNVQLKRLPVKRKVENEVTPSKKIRLVKEKSEPKVEQKSIAVVRTRNSNNVNKPAVFQRLAGGANEKQNLEVTNRFKETPASSVFDRLGPQHLLQSEKPIQIKSAPQISKQKITLVNKNVVNPISSSNRKIVVNNSPKISTSKQITQSCIMRNTNLTFSQLVGSESSSQMKSLQSNDQKVTARLGTKPVITKLSSISRGDSQGIFASRPNLTVSNPIRERLGLNTNKPSPISGGKWIKTSLRQDMVEPRKRITFDNDRLGSPKPVSPSKFVSTVSGSVFSRLGH